MKAPTIIIGAKRWLVVATFIIAGGLVAGLGIGRGLVALASVGDAARARPALALSAYRDATTTRDAARSGPEAACRDGAIPAAVVKDGGEVLCAGGARLKIITVGEAEAGGSERAGVAGIVDRGAPTVTGRSAASGQRWLGSQLAGGGSLLVRGDGSISRTAPLSFGEDAPRPRGGLINDHIIFLCVCP